MIHAYQETYLNKAQNLLGETFDYAINYLHIDGQRFLDCFALSEQAKRIEKGDVSIILGKSGAELATEIISQAYRVKKFEPISIDYDGRSIQYWIGWAIAYCQWLFDKAFQEIFAVISYEDLCNMYYPLHEADITKFAGIINTAMVASDARTNLRKYRDIKGCSQSDLARLSGVSLRSIQMYEQRKKDINKASAETLYRLAKSLGCEMENLLEKRIEIMPDGY